MNEIERFIKRMVTGDEKWITFDTNLRKRSWSKRSEAPQTVTKPGLMAMKVLLSIDQKRPELAIRRGDVLHKDNARPHTSVMTHQKFWEPDWEVLMHPPYSPDPAPSEYPLFIALQNFLSDTKLGSREDCENPLLEFFVNEDQYFYERGIMKLPLKWQYIVQQNGAYLTQI
ncbi:histone-lysine N-methyltransferase SETMAR [Trichonephila clavipes]|uniref:Histone-lysine N-methyltransferase SETMAR n=1 Tax=Trichonephila clavipes TaxID=2585209 RepID=A0A8X6VYD8_TRICX|nr:histone-lysine N-methyltransferase SETMAR [Trichonephila clavipes]